MITLDPIEEVQLIGVADAGVPNKERIIFRASGCGNLQQYQVGLGVQYYLGDRTFFTPIANYVYHFTELEPEPGSWIVLYTGKGQFQDTRIPLTHERAYSMHWGQENIIFSRKEIIPVLYRLSGFAYPPGSRDAQLGWQTPPSLSLTNGPQNTPKPSNPYKSLPYSNWKK